MSATNSKQEVRPPSGPQTVVEDTDSYGDGPVFIYGGPWIKINKPSMFMDTLTPINVQLSGIFKKSYAYYSLKERTPAMLTKVIDVAARRQYGPFVQYVAKLKHDLVTNKQYEKFQGDDEEVEKWNAWVDDQSPKNYFGNAWVWTECYVYRRIVEGLQLNNLNDFDPFEQIKQEALFGNVEPMCVVAERMMDYIQEKEDDEFRRPKMKEEWISLLKVSLWANRCDLSLSLCEKADMKDVCPLPILAFPKPGAKPKPLKKGKLPPVAPPLTNLGYIDPFQISLDLKFNLLADDSAKSFEQLMARSNKIRANIEKVKEKDRDKPEPDWVAMFPPKGTKKPKGKKAPPPPPPAEGEVVEPVEEPKKIPCPAKMTVPQSVFLDIVCDNSGYELFSDLCIAHWALAQGIVDKVCKELYNPPKVRFHVKKYPWFVSDVTERDFLFVINQCKAAQFAKDTVIPPRPVPEGEEAPPPETRSIRSAALNQIANVWQTFLDEGKFMLMAEDYWTYPCTYNQMKKVDPNMYRKLQYAAMILFKGDLNYRKLLGERNAVPATALEPNLQGFIPAPIVALRTVKSELICGLPKGRYDQLNKFDPKWMEKGNFGVIQMSKKPEAFPKQPQKPCVDYGITCFGEKCPEHDDI